MLMTERLARNAKEDNTCLVQPGDSFPLGATVREGGINFCVYAPGAIAVDLLLFSTPDAPDVQTTI